MPGRPTWGVAVGAVPSAGGLTTSVTKRWGWCCFPGALLPDVGVVGVSTFDGGIAADLVQYDYRAESALAGMMLVTLGLVSAFLDMFGASAHRRRRF